MLRSVYPIRDSDFDSLNRFMYLCCMDLQSVEFNLVLYFLQLKNFKGSVVNEKYHSHIGKS
jgi:hypothetical protein